MPELPAARSRHAAVQPFLWGVAATLALFATALTVIERTSIVDRFVRPLTLADTAGRADIIVVLAAGVTQSCTPNSYALQRVLLAARLFQEGRASLMLFSGGRRGEASCTAADSMRDLAVRLGVPSNRIRVERTSTSTWQNAVRSAAVLRILGARRILLVTDRAHMSRAAASFSRFGFAIERAAVPIPLGHANNRSLLWMGLREYAAWVYYRARGYVGEKPVLPALVESLGSVGDIEEESSVARAVNGPVVILGASYAEGWDLPSTEGLRFVNKGVAGEQSFEMLERFDADVADESPRSVIVWGFINDIFRSPRPELAKGLDRVRKSYLGIIHRSRTLGIEPVLATEVTIRHKPVWRDELAALVAGVIGRQGYSDYINRHVLDTNEWIRELALREKLLLLDLEPVLSNGSGQRRRAYTAVDGSHITPAGYDALRRYALPILTEHFLPPIPPPTR